MPSPFPHRVTLLPPVLELPSEARGLEGAVADVLGAVVHGQLVRHPIVSLLDPDEQPKLDDDGRLLAMGHEAAGHLLDRAFLDDRRDEVVWFELAVEPSRAMRAKLRVVTAEDRTDEEHNAIGDPTLSGLLSTCVAQWLASRHLPASLGAWPLFGAAELLRSAAQVARFREDALRDVQVAAPAPGFGATLEVAALRAAWIGMPHGEAHRASVRRALALVPDDPHALRAEALYRIGEGASPHEVMAPVVALAPQWGPPRLAMHGAGLPEAEALRHASVGALLLPGDARALHAYALALLRAGRFEEAARVAERAAALDPAFAQARATCVRALRDTHRSGEAYLVARGRVAEMAAGEGGEDPHGLASLSLLHAETCFDVGRLDEAIQLARSALDRVQEPDAFRRQRDEIESWQRDADVLAASYARDGHYRADPGRVVLGFARSRPRYSLDVAMLMRALEALGHDDLATLASAHHLGGGGVAPGPHARIARASALLLEGDVEGALEDLVVLQLRYPQSKVESASHRALRLGVAHGPAPFERAVRARLDAGARRVARLIARDAADFVPGLEASAPVLEALGPRASVGFDPTWLEGLVEVLDSRSLVAIDAFFGQYRRPTLEHADRLAGDWHLLIAPSKPDEPTWLEQVLYVLGQALGRYLAASTEPPNVLAGGYRQVAADALALLARFGRDWQSEWLPALFAVLEQASTGVDPWLLDVWLLRVERALGLEHETGGHLASALRDTPRMRRAVRGDERIAFEHTFALELLAEGHAEQAAELLERTVRAIGSGAPALRWSEAARQRGGDALDVHWTAALAHPTHAAPSVHLARALFAAKRGEQAFDVLVRALPFANAQWRSRALSELRPIWEEADLGVPFDADAARTQGQAQLARGETEAALRCLRWSNACEPHEADTLEALAEAFARRGERAQVLAAIAELDRAGAPSRAAETLARAGRPEDALRLRRYAALCSAELEPDALARADGPASEARRALARGEREAAITLCGGDTSWPARAVVLWAAEMRVDGDEPAPVRRAALLAAEDVLRASVGASTRDAVLARAHALAVRESYCFPIDPRPPGGAPYPRDRFESAWRARAGKAVDQERPTVPLETAPLERPDAAPAPEAATTALRVRPAAMVAPQRLASFHSTQPLPAMTLTALGANDAEASPGAGPETEVFPGEPCPRLSSFVGALAAFSGADPLRTLGAAGLDLASFGRAAARWGALLVADASMHERFVAAWRARGAAQQAGQESADRTGGGGEPS